jgi:hypothetical protein
MPVSRSRKKADFTPPVRKGSGSGGPTMSARWVAPVMVACFVIGLAWIVVYYLAGDRISVLTQLGNWNIVIGIGMFGLGFVFATRWK